MALKPQNRWWARIHFLIRLLGLTGLLVGGIGAAVVARERLVSWEALVALDQKASERLWEILLGESGDPVQQWAIRLTAGGFVAVLLAALVEIVRGLGMTAGRRSAFGLNAAV